MLVACARAVRPSAAVDASCRRRRWLAAAAAVARAWARGAYRMRPGHALASSHAPRRAPHRCVILTSVGALRVLRLFNLFVTK